MSCLSGEVAYVECVACEYPSPSEVWPDFDGWFWCECYGLSAVAAQMVYFVGVCVLQHGGKVVVFGFDVCGVYVVYLLYGLVYVFSCLPKRLFRRGDGVVVCHEAFRQECDDDDEYGSCHASVVF